MRRWVWLCLLVLPVVAFAQTRGHFNQMDCTGTTQEVVSANSNRLFVTVFNVGTIPVWLNSSSSHTTAAVTTGFTIHAGASVEFRGYKGQLNCITEGGATRLNIIQEVN